MKRDQNQIEIYNMKRLIINTQKSPDPISFEIVKQSENELIFISPKKKGAYRLFAFVKNDKGQSSVANIPFLIQ